MPENINPNIFRGLTVDIKEKLRVAMLDSVFRIMREQRRKTHPSRDLLMKFISKDIRRVIERLHEGLLHRHVGTQYFVLYKGSQGRKAFKLVQFDSEDMVAFKALVELYKPAWARRSESYPLAHSIPDDDCFPYICFWPQLFE